jgi:hypothetical protein
MTLAADERFADFGILHGGDPFTPGKLEFARWRHCKFRAAATYRENAHGD